MVLIILVIYTLLRLITRVGVITWKFLPVTDEYVMGVVVYQPSHMTRHLSNTKNPPLGPSAL